MAGNDLYLPSDDEPTSMLVEEPPKEPVLQAGFLLSWQIGTEMLAGVAAKLWPVGFGVPAPAKHDPRNALTRAVRDHFATKSRSYTVLPRGRTSVVDVLFNLPNAASQPWMHFAWLSANGSSVSMEGPGADDEDRDAIAVLYNQYADCVDPDQLDPRMQNAARDQGGVLLAPSKDVWLMPAEKEMTWRSYVNAFQTSWRWATVAGGDPARRPTIRLSALTEDDLERVVRNVADSARAQIERLRAGLTQVPASSSKQSVSFMQQDLIRLRDARGYLDWCSKMLTEAEAEVEATLAATKAVAAEQK